ncbi:MAG: TIGR03086 family metal-binding protein [Actinomycetota bacterium]|nr:TIGR03086 family metal-binding protein [Actinomycetota bacterium]
MAFDKTVFLPLDPDAVFDLITQPERLRRWKTVSARLDLRVAGEYRWTIVPGHSAAGTFSEIEPGRHIVFSWGWEGSADLPPGASTVSITLDAADGGTNLRLVHDGLTGEQAADHAEGWNHFLGRLVAFGTTGDAGADEWSAAPDPLNELNSAEAALAIVQRVLHSLTEADLSKPTPCSDFTVAGLVDHLFGSVAGIGRALGAAVAEGAAPSSAAADGTSSGAANRPSSAEVRIADAAQVTLEAFTRRGLQGTIEMGFAELPATIVASILNIEFLVHAWDLAVATGQTVDVAPVLSDYVLGLARITISPRQRASGSFSEATVVDESAASLDRLIAFTGRQVSASYGARSG